MNFNIDIDTTEVQRDLDRLRDDLQRKAISRALNKAAHQGRTAAGREIKQRYNLSTHVFNKTVKFKNAKPNTLEVTMRVEGKPFPVMAFKARQNKKGVSFAIGSKRIVVPHAFITTMASGHKGVFARGGYQKTSNVLATGETWGKSFRFGSLRHPISELKTFSAPYAFMNGAVQRELRIKINEKFPGLLEHEIKWALSK